MTTTIVIRSLCLQLQTPKFSKNEFGYYASFKTHFQIGKCGMAIVVMGFGVAFIIKNLMPKDSQWFWGVWEQESIFKKKGAQNGK